jgi:hypothetical protein
MFFVSVKSNKKRINCLPLLPVPITASRTLSDGFLRVGLLSANASSQGMEANVAADPEMASFFKNSLREWYRILSIVLL